MKIIFNNGNVLTLNNGDAEVVRNILTTQRDVKFVVITENHKFKYLINMDNVAYIKDV